jgi:hypothetical protein
MRVRNTAAKPPVRAALRGFVRVLRRRTAAKGDDGGVFAVALRRRYAEKIKG